jgi:Cof subfamily protein (haloacid dehalogenase superfamily)
MCNINKPVGFVISPLHKGSDSEMERTFEDWLIVSDVDGTLNNKFRRLPKNNYSAIKRFTELGGNFTLASGRTVVSISRTYNKIPANQPAIILNGGAIYDVQSQKTLWSSPIGESGRQFVRDIAKKFCMQFYALDIGIFTENLAYLVRNGVFANTMLAFDRAPYIVTNMDNVPDEGWLKVIFWGAPKTIKALKRHIDNVGNPEAHFMDSSIVTLEMLQKGTHKGTAVLKLADMLGIDHSHVAAIGNYYNDLDMLKSVGFPACAAQSPKPIHEICKYEACHCNHGCVADLIDHIMSMETKRFMEA